MSNWTKEELMICAAADVIQDHDVALVGIGLPTLAAMVAKQTNAPNLQMIFESGAIDAVPNDLPQGPGDFPLLRTSTIPPISVLFFYTYFLMTLQNYYFIIRKPKLTSKFYHLLIQLQLLHRHNQLQKEDSL